jgi:hypothetical protein
MGATKYGKVRMKEGITSRQRSHAEERVGWRAPNRAPEVDHGWQLAPVPFAT